MRSRSPLHGFTLVELLVVIAIIGVLVALLLPAVQAAREAARRMQCANNLKQIGLALQNYHSARNEFPAGATSSWSLQDAWDILDESTNGEHGTSWMLQVLPYLEQTVLYDRWDFSRNVAGNVDVAQTDVPAFYCPSRRNTVRSEDMGIMFLDWSQGGNDYGGCYCGSNGFWNDIFQPAKCIHKIGNIDFASGSLIGRDDLLGILRVNIPVKISQILDGTSNTLMVGEMQRLNNPSTCDKRSLDGWATGGVATLFVTDSNLSWGNPGGINNDFFESAGSEHPGVAQFAVADGSVRTISENIDTELFMFLGPIADGATGSIP